MTTKTKRGEGTRRRERRVLYEQLRLQADILCDSNDRERERAVLSRMFGLMLEVTKQERKINAQTRQVLADHFMDSPYAAGDEPSVELGGPDDRNHLHISGSFDVEELSKRLVWSSQRYKEMIDA
jgi:hypothetical protein